MKLQVYSIFDNALKVYSQPFVLPTTAVAIRSFSELLKDENSQIAKHPADFFLFQLAEYDDEVGQFQNMHAPQKVAHALEFTQPAVTH